MSSNYPPGVTGREYEIAGGDFYTVERTCENEEATLLVADADIKEAILDVLIDLARIEERLNLADQGDLLMRVQLVSRKVQRLENRLTEHELPCPFEGKVELEVYRTQGWWDCPTCGTHTEEVMEPEEYDE